MAAQGSPKIRAQLGRVARTILEIKASGPASACDTCENARGDVDPAALPACPVSWTNAASIRFHALSTSSVFLVVREPSCLVRLHTAPRRARLTSAIRHCPIRIPLNSQYHLSPERYPNATPRQPCLTWTTCQARPRYVVQYRWKRFTQARHSEAGVPGPFFAGLLCFTKLLPWIELLWKPEGGA